MTQRLLEIIVPDSAAADLCALLADYNTVDTQIISLHEEMCLVRTLLPSPDTEVLSDAISEQFGYHDGFRIIFYAVEATIPPPETEEAEPETEDEAETDQEIKLNLGRINREELYADVAPGARLSATYLITVFLSALVAAIGLLFDDVAIIIGAMVIAPLLRPNVALALSVTLGDRALIKQSIITGFVGTLVAFLLPVLIGFAFPVDPEITQVAARATVRFGHILLALAAGVAGALAFTTGVSATLIGVMVAVALLPPLVTAGLLLGAGYLNLASRAFLLFLTNVTGVDLASVLTFLVQGIRPRRWWEAEKAKQASRIAISFWLILLFIFLVLILLLKR